MNAVFLKKGMELKKRKIALAHEPANIKTESKSPKPSVADSCFGVGNQKRPYSRARLTVFDKRAAAFFRAVEALVSWNYTQPMVKNALVFPRFVAFDGCFETQFWKAHIDRFLGGAMHDA